MFCSRCGSGLSPSSAYCASCGAPVAGSSAAATAVGITAVRRPAIITLLAVLQFISGGLMLIGGAFGIFGVLLDPQASAELGALPLIVLSVVIGFAVFQLATGIGLWRLRPYGRILQIVSSVIGLLGIPIGTIISVAILIYMNKPGIKVLFSGKKPEEMTQQELAEVAAVTSGGAGIVIVVVVIAILLIVLLGIIAAIAVPGLLRARMAGNEASTIGTLRSILSAQVAYAASANGGYYDTMTCLANPAPCVPSYSGSSFLQEAYSTRNGYIFELTGTPAPADRPSTTSRTSLASFVVIARPVTPASTGVRVFCMDQTGTIRASTDGVPSGLSTDACPTSWPPID